MEDKIWACGYCGTVVVTIPCKGCGEDCSHTVVELRQEGVLKEIILKALESGEYNTVKVF